MDVKVRRAIPDDAEVLSEIAFSAKAHWDYPKEWMEIWKPQFDFSPDYFNQNESWVIEIDQNPVAFCTLQERDGNAWIENMWVLPAYIGKGIGKQLFTYALSRSRDLGFSKLRLEADPNAVGFYEKMGMVKIGEHNYPIEGQPRILPVMEILL